MSFRIDFDLRSLERVVDEMAEEVQQAVRPAAQAGAQVLYERVKLNVRSSTKGHWFHGTSFKKNGTKYWITPGNLNRAIYQAFVEKLSSADQSTYRISWNHKKAPYGHMVEYGTVRAPAHPFIRPAKAFYPRALEVTRAKFFDGLKSFK